MKKIGLLLLAVVFVLSFPVYGAAAEEVVTYKVPVISDFTGGYAELFKAWVPVQKAVFGYWNDTTGKELGVKLELKHYDGRYDPTVIASLWPGALADCKPVIIGLGGGGADVAALQQRLPQDEVPMIYGTAAYGYGWIPDQWLFQVRPTYLHEFAAALRWYIDKHPEKRPVRFGVIGINIQASLDLVKGIQKYVKDNLEPKGLCVISDVKFSELNPVDMSSQVKAMIDSKTDIVAGPATTAMAIAYMRACQTYGVNIPTIASPHHTIWPYAKAMKTYEPFTGHLVAAGHVSITDKNSATYKWFKEDLMGKYKLPEALWNVYSMMALNQSILAVRAVEHAAKKVGAKNLTGRAVYEALLADPFTTEELMGSLPSLKFTKDAPFSLYDPKVMLETVKDGQYVLADPNWVLVPKDVEKW
ncbi:MAG: ABC transporter substrate-binding protein [Proteobacteria bacterium]|nr:ABC transporter substrate-binding protein [Pseudomonadota bacterium]